MADPSEELFEDLDTVVAEAVTAPGRVVDRDWRVPAADLGPGASQEKSGPFSRDRLIS